MIIRYVIKFLAKVAEHSDVNKMNASNLGIVIGPNLLWPPGENRSELVFYFVQHHFRLVLSIINEIETEFLYNLDSFNYSQ